MELNIDKNDFITVLQRIQGIVEKRNTMPILANVLMEAGGNSVNILATDLEIFIKDTCAASVKKNGSITVNARKLFEIIRQLPESSINIKAGEGDRISIKSGTARFNIVGLSSKEFPAFPIIDEGKLSKIEPEDLKDMVDKTAFAVSTDETRYNINGFFLERGDSTIRMVTTDGHRLAMIEKETANIPAENGGVILPRKGVTEIRRLLEEEGAFFFGITKKSATMKKDNTVINIRLIEGEFPDYKQVVPKDNDRRAVLEKNNLLDSLKRVSILSSEKVKGVKFAFSDGKLVLSSSSPDIGDATEELPAEYNGGDMEIAFNARYFIEALEAIGDEKVAIELKDPLSPGLLKPAGAGAYTYIVMPMRL
ncbi:MAG: DNA polymerase III subunit beta [Deltaproteobacteria bacterium]|nr:DNA polymerase III subunit beta [Deltaproteobacteria bacterium]